MLNPPELLPERRMQLAVPIEVRTPHPAPAVAHPAAAGAPPAEPGGGESLDIREVMAVVRRHLVLVLGFAFAAAAAVAYMVYRLPDRFESDATVRMADARSALTDGLDNNPIQRLAGPTRDPLLSQMEILRSRTLLGRVVDAQGLRLYLTRPARNEGILTAVQVDPGARPDTFDVRFGPASATLAHRGRAQTVRYGEPVTVPGARFTIAARPGVDRSEILILPREKAIDELLQHVSARPREDTDLFDLSFSSADPRTARRVLDGMINAFQAQNAAHAQDESRRRRVFLEQQLNETDSTLTQAQLALADFQRHKQVFSTVQSFTSQQAGLDQLTAQREALVADRETGRTLLAAAERRGSDPRSLRALVAAPSVAANPVIVQLYQDLVRFEGERDSLTTGPFRSAPTNPDVQRLNSLVATTQASIADAVRGQVTSLDARIASLDRLMAGRSAQIGRLPDVGAEEVRLTQQVATTQAVADELRTELQKARITEAVEVGSVEVVDRASLPVLPVPAHRGLRVFFGLLLGLVFGGAAAMLRERTNTSIRRREELEQVLQLSALAVVPQLGKNGTGAAARLRRGTGTSLEKHVDGQLDPSLVATADGRSPGADAYRTLRTNLIFSQALQLKTLVVTSSGPGEGKTTTSANLAATFAHQGLKVALVDCDLRRPRVHGMFGVEKEPGLTQVILGFASTAEAVRATPIPNLFVLPCGTLPPNPSELLGSERMREVLMRLQGEHDLVILDTPPVLLAPDAAILGAGADGVVLVVRAGVTDRNAAVDAVQQLRTVGSNLVGTVLNDPDSKVQSYSRYYSYRYYGYDAEG